MSSDVAAAAKKKKASLQQGTAGSSSSSIEQQREQLVALKQAILESDYEEILQLTTSILENPYFFEDLPPEKKETIQELQKQAQLHLPNQIGRLLGKGSIYHAYACYRLQQYQKCIDSSSDDKRLQAQAYYHLDQFREASEIYQELINEDKNDIDLIINQLAVKADTMPPCQLIGSNQVTDSNILSLLEEGVADDDDRLDLIHNLLLAYPGDSVLLRKVYSTGEPIALFNYYFGKEDTDAVESDEGDLTDTQRKVHLYNEAVRCYQSRQYKQCHELFVKLTKQVKDSLWWRGRLLILQAYCEGKQSVTSTKTNESIKTTIQELQNNASSAENQDVLAYLLLHQAALAQQQLSGKNGQETVDVVPLLRSLPPLIREKPATKCLLYRLTEEPHDDNDSLFLADYYLSQQEYEKAAEMYCRLHSKATDDDTAGLLMARRVQALSRTKPLEAVKLWTEFRASLNVTDDTPELSEEESLETKPLPERGSRKNHPSLKEIVMIDNSPRDTSSSLRKKSRDSILRRRAKRRQAYVSSLSEYDQTKTPDPERWIPKYERSSSRRYKRGSAVHRGAQGSGRSNNTTDKLDIVARQEARARGEVDSFSTAHLVATVGGGSSRNKGGRRR